MPVKYLDCIYCTMALRFNILCKLMSYLSNYYNISSKAVKIINK